jgi:short subunit dehydrogenase-like uncharacterized protein
LRTRLAASRAACADAPLLALDAANRDALRAVATSTRVLVNAVGPYTAHGDPVVAACAQAGTDYVDLAGEAEFVDRSYVSHHALATRTGARLVHSCGFDSLPFDLGVLFTVLALPAGVPIRVSALAELHLGGARTAARSFSTGSMRSALVSLSRPHARRRANAARRALEAMPPGRSVTLPARRPRRSSEPRGWALPAPRFDAHVVRRSAAALERYGPEFSYEQYVLARRPATAAAAICLAGALYGAARFAPARELILARLPANGGPSASERAQRSFAITFVGEGGGQRVRSRVCGGDPGYEESAKMLAESALCLAHDELAPRSGSLTPAVAMGEPLIARLQRRGLRFATNSA